MWQVMMGRLPFLGLSNEVSRIFPNDKISGYYGFFGTPILVINDLDVAKRILVQDFNHFTDKFNFEL